MNTIQTHACVQYNVCLQYNYSPQHCWLKLFCPKSTLGETCCELAWMKIAWHVLCLTKTLNKLIILRLVSLYSLCENVSIWVWVCNRHSIFEQTLLIGICIRTVHKSQMKVCQYRKARLFASLAAALWKHYSAVWICYGYSSYCSNYNHQLFFTRLTMIWRTFFTHSTACLL